MFKLMPRPVLHRTKFLADVEKRGRSAGRGAIVRDVDRQNVHLPVHEFHQSRHARFDAIEAAFFDKFIIGRNEQAAAMGQDIGVIAQRLFDLSNMAAAQATRQLRAEDGKG